MAFDFPASPTDGQTYKPAGGPEYMWSASAGAWQILTIASAGVAYVYIGDNPPANPSHGQLWVESDTGLEFCWWDDGTSAQWVQTNGTGIVDAPNDGKIYGRGAGVWTPAVASTAGPRNRIVNGAMQVSQEMVNTAMLNGGYPADCFYFACNTGAAQIYAQRVQVVTPNGSQNRIRITVGVAKGSVAAGEYIQLIQYIEGNRVDDFLWGTASARKAIVRFGFKGPAGTYSLAIQNVQVSSRSYIQQFTITAGQANTDTTQTFVIPGDVTGTWAIGTGAGLCVTLALAVGSSYQGVAGTWNAVNVFGASTTSNGMSSTSNVFEYYDVGLYLDPTNTGLPPPWEEPDFVTELAICQRYFVWIWVEIVATATGAGSYASTYLAYPSHMRVPPAASPSGDGAPTQISTISFDSPTVYAIRCYIVSSAAGTFAIAGRSCKLNARL